MEGKGGGVRERGSVLQVAISPKREVSTRGIPIRRVAAPKVWRPKIPHGS
jgi:hypothetical protein